MVFETVKEIKFDILGSVEIDLSNSQDQKKRKRKTDDYDYEDDFIEPFEGENDLVYIECKLENFFVYKGEMKATGKRILSVYKNRIKRKENVSVVQEEERKFFRANVNDPLKIQIEASVGFSLDCEEEKVKRKGRKKQTVPNNNKIKLPMTPLKKVELEEIHFLKTLLIAKNPNLQTQRRLPNKVQLDRFSSDGDFVSRGNQKQSPNLLNLLQISSPIKKEINEKNCKLKKEEKNAVEILTNFPLKRVSNVKVDGVPVSRLDVEPPNKIPIEVPNKIPNEISSVPNEVPIVKTPFFVKEEDSVCVVDEIKSSPHQLVPTHNIPKWMSNSGRSVLKAYLKLKLKTMEDFLNNKITQIFFFYFNLIGNDTTSEEYIINFSLLEKYLPKRSGEDNKNYYKCINNLIEESDLKEFLKVLDFHLEKTISLLENTAKNFSFHSPDGKNFEAFQSHSFLCNCIIFFYLTCCKEIHNGSKYSKAFDRAKEIILRLFSSDIKVNNFLQQMNLKLKELIKEGDFSI